MHTGQGDRLNLPFSKLLVFHDHDIDLGLGHMACHRISFIGMCLHTTVPHFIEIGKMDGQQDLLHSGADLKRSSTHKLATRRNFNYHKNKYACMATLIVQDVILINH